VPETPRAATVWADLKADIALMRSRRTDHDLLLPYLFPHLFSVAAYRLAHALGRRGLSPLARLIQILSLTLTGAELDWRAEIGPGLFLEHPQGVEVGDGVVIGRDVVLGLGVLLGSTAHRPSKTGFPTIGNGVEIWAKASVLGPVHVGDGAVIGAHALVLHDVPAGAVARGVPAQAYVDGELQQR
jgi:serine O-acetyltransferase